MEVLDLVHSHLTEQRVLGVRRTFVKENTTVKPRLVLSHYCNPELQLAIISQNGSTGVKVESHFLIRKSVSTQNWTKIDLIDPQGLNGLERVLKEIVGRFNDFLKDYKTYYPVLSRVGNNIKLTEHVYKAE